VAKVSVILAARNERHLPRMVAHLLTRLTGDFEILVGLDGPHYQFEGLPKDHRVVAYHWPPRGLKPTVNDLAACASGKYLMKMDAHCAVSEGIDEVLQRDMQPNWMVVPRFYTLDEHTWAPHPGKRHNDYWNVSCPLTDRKGYRFAAGGYWFERTAALAGVGPLDESMTHHGSCWFVERDFFLNKLGGMQSEGYGVNYMEPADLGFRTWLGPWDGRVMVNKSAWYGHLHQDHRERGYGIDWAEVKRSYLWTAEHWMRNQDAQQVRPLAWLIDRFAPVPTWPANWRELQAEYDRKQGVTAHG
jgi:glycosyltransferase involved in cell wall biosynthesis